MPGLSSDQRERLHVPVTWWLLGSLFVVAVGWAFFVATPALVALAAAGVALVIVVWTLSGYGALEVSTSSAGLRAGRATLPWRHLGTVTPLAGSRLRDTLGVEADARAYLVVRSYCHQAVKVEVVDDVDPTPYWVVSTRHAEQLAAHLRARSVQG